MQNFQFSKLCADTNQTSFTYYMIISKTSNNIISLTALLSFRLKLSIDINLHCSCYNVK